MNQVYEKAYAEILEIIQYLPLEQYKQIPQEKINFYEKHKDITHNFKYNPSKTLQEQNTLRETNALIILLFRNFFATETQKDKVDLILQNNEDEHQSKLKEKYSYDKLFKRKMTNTIEKKNNLQIVVYKENTFTKIFNFIKKIFS